MHPLERQIQAIELLSGKPVVAVTINHEQMTPEQARQVCSRIQKATGLPTVDVLLDGPSALVKTLQPFLRRATE